MIDDLAKQTKYFRGNPEYRFKKVILEPLHPTLSTKLIDQKEDEANLKYARRVRTLSSVTKMVLSFVLEKYRILVSKVPLLQRFHHPRNDRE